MKPYRHKLSAEDGDTGTILITKDRWRAFPPPMQEFQVRVGKRTFATRIVAEDSSCLPPAHQHLHLEARHFRQLLDFSRGAIVEIDVAGDGAPIIRNG